MTVEEQLLESDYFTKDPEDDEFVVRITKYFKLTICGGDAYIEVRKSFYSPWQKPNDAWCRKTFGVSSSKYNPEPPQLNTNLTYDECIYYAKLIDEVQSKLKIFPKEAFSDEVPF